MKTISKKLSLAAVLTLAASQPAFASDWSVGVFAGQSSADSLQDDVCRPITLQTNIQLAISGISGRISCQADDNDSALGLNIAYNFNSTWGLEVGYVDLGEYSLTLSGVGEPQSIAIELDAPYIAGVATYPLSNKFSASARLGAFNANANISSSTSNISQDVESDDAEVYSGISLDYQLTDTFSAQLRYDSFAEFDIIGLGMKVHF